MVEMKNLPAGMERYIAKKVDKAWRVYDKARGSFPYTNGDTGTVQQDVPEDIAVSEAARLNGVTVKPETVELKTKAAKNTTPAVEPDELPVKEEDIADYGLMTKEERAAYEDGLIEKVTY
jgi:hypothetical protein